MSVIQTPLSNASKITWESLGINPMTSRVRDFQIFAKPASYRCNLACGYCYYLGKADLFPTDPKPLMQDSLLEAYIRQHIAAYPGEIVRFSWHGGEPTLLGLDYFQRIIDLQKR